MSTGTVGADRGCRFVLAGLLSLWRCYHKSIVFTVAFSCLHRPFLPALPSPHLSLTDNTPAGVSNRHMHGACIDGYYFRIPNRGRNGLVFFLTAHAVLINARPVGVIHYPVAPDRSIEARDWTDCYSYIRALNMAGRTAYLHGTLISPHPMVPEHGLPLPGVYDSFLEPNTARPPGGGYIALEAAAECLRRFLFFSLNTRAWSTVQDAPSQRELSGLRMRKVESASIRAREA